MARNIPVEFRDFFTARAILNLFVQWAEKRPIAELRCVFRTQGARDDLALDLLREHLRRLDIAADFADLVPQSDDADEEEGVEEPDAHAPPRGESIAPVMAVEVRQPEAACSEV